MERIKLLGSIIINDCRCTKEIKCRIPRENVVLWKEKVDLRQIKCFTKKKFIVELCLERGTVRSTGESYEKL